MPGDLGGGEGEPVRLIDQFQALISEGHRFDDLRRYTPRQIRAFYLSIVRLRCRREAADLCNTATAFGSSDEINKRLSVLNNTADLL